MKILITGGAGFIGSALIRYLLTHTTHQVINVDKLTYAANLQSLAAISRHPGYTFEQADICNSSELARIFSQHQPDAVMHLAAESHVDRSILGAADFIQTNIVGTYILLEAARDYWSRLPAAQRRAFRFHHISTDEVYGDLSSNQNPVNESAPYAPSSPYSATKASSDHLVRAWYRTYGFPVLLSNCSNNYGPYQYPEKLIPAMILNALAGQPLTVYGNGLQIRDWLYVEDHVRALVCILTQGQVGETYNIGHSNEKENIEVVRTICILLAEYLHSDSEQFLKLIRFVQDRPGHDQRYAIDSSKIQRELDWRPQESFDSGLRKTLLWYLDNRAWWQQIMDK